MAAQDATLPGNVPGAYENHRMTGDPGTSILAILVVLARRKLLIAGSTFILMSAAAISVALMPDSFKAEAVILPPQQQQSSLAALASGALGNLAGSGMASQLGLKNTADLYIGILKSHTISDEIIAQFHLQDLYHQKFLSDTRGALRKHTTFASGKESLITISVEDHDPKRAAAMANAFVDELYKLNSQIAITDASQRRLFFEQQLRKEKDTLSEAEIALKNTQQSTGLVVPSGQAEVLIRSAAQLRAEIASRQVALQAARSYATDRNPQIQILQREISAMQGQLAQIETDGAQNGPLEIAGGKLPEASLAYMRKFRNLKYHETLYELLAKQYEAAVIDEAKQAPVIQVIDRAKTPDKRSGPARGALVFASGLLGVMLTSVCVLTVHNLRMLSLDPRQAETVAALRAAVRLRGEVLQL
jgi:tyrosine-protein kinase Etk/Wzc